MLRIAICDDDKIICQQLEDMLTDIEEETNEQYEVEVFYSGEELYRYLKKNNRYNLIFLDIEMRDLNGVEVGKKIRDEMNDETTQIVYISGREDYAMDLFEVRPLNFLIKPVSKNKVEAAVNKAIKILGESKHFYEYKNGNVNFSVSVGDILYFESDGRKVNIILMDDVKSFYGKLSEVEEKLRNQDFIMIHKSYLINFNHVIEYTYDYVKMSNKETLTISQNNRKAVREQLLRRKQRLNHDK
ncbi:LytTR family DNA-binding domain-containing protein [Sedimentibacter sp. B4]|uniref:LytR/AlgR family response regulator transcription factor n=1 Tax=Sedimentibacter sp. B4 TaxID=304766 RepID=UPI00030E8728|nr:LytTR family DNA-binding domain-containing protein [Sedimentibacter sp. B4]